MADATKQRSLVFSPREIDFFAQDDLITIVPKFSIQTPTRKLDCIMGSFGPFGPGRECEVPLWMALALWKRKKCDIKPPEWMDPEYLQTVLDLERGDPLSFQPLPFHYQEIAQFLFTAGTQESLPKAVFDDKEAKVRDLINLIQKTRLGKILQGLSSIQEAAAVKLNNLSAMELNAVRAFFAGTLDEFTRHANMREHAPLAAYTVGEDASQQPVEDASPARQLRRPR
jgi:GINS complex subunit 2